MRPCARRDDLVLQQLADELLVYDARSHRAHCLNVGSAAVFRLCDGRRTLAAITRELRRRHDPAVDEAWVRLAVEDLRRAGLLVAESIAPISPARRRALHRLAQAAMVPVIASIASPTAAQSGTPCNPNAPGCTANDSPCIRSIECCSCCCKDVGGGARACKPGGGNCL